jgi:hypothetical protein
MIKEKYKINERKDDFSSPIEPYPKETRDLIPAMKVYLHGRNLSYETARRNLWYPTYEVKERDLVPRIVIPAVNKYNRPYWQARAILKHDLRYRSAKGGRFGSIVVVWPKVVAVNTVGERQWGCAPVVLVEGPTDALAAAGLGYFSIATMGALFSSYALKYLNKKISKDVPVIVVPDLDCPEFGAETITILSASGYRVTMRMPEGVKDLAGMKPDERRRLLEI